MKITDLQITRYRDAGIVDGAPEILIVTVDTDDGPVGTGFVNASAKTGELYAHLLRRILRDAILGMDPRLTRDVWRKMYEAIPRRGGDGIVRFCMAAVDFALWDIKGKLANVPVSALLGSHRNKIPTYANCAHHLPVEALAERAAQYVERGHRALKIRGTRSFVSLDEATERVKNVRAAIGPDVKLMVDVNGSWDVDTAIAQLKRWEAYDVCWLEEPVPPSDISGYRRIKERAGSTYIVGGEQHVGVAEFRSLIEHGGIDIAQPNAAMTGGITEWLDIHAYATSLNVPVSPWDLQMIHLHMAAGLENVKWIEYFMADNAILEFQGKLFDGPRSREEVTPEGVVLLAPSGPGLGLTLDPAVADASRIAD